MTTRVELERRIGEYGDARVAAALARVTDGAGYQSGMHEVEADRILIELGDAFAAMAERGADGED